MKCVKGECPYPDCSRVIEFHPDEKFSQGEIMSEKCPCEHGRLVDMQVSIVIDLQPGEAVSSEPVMTDAGLGVPVEIKKGEKDFPESLEDVFSGEFDDE